MDMAPGAEGRACRGRASVRPSCPPSSCRSRRPSQGCAAPEGPRQAAQGRMVIEVGRGRRVVVDGAVDADALARVLDVLDRR